MSTSTSGPPGGSTALLTDQYELTMLRSALADGTAYRRAVFEVFARRLPTGRRFGIVAGQGRLAQLVPRIAYDVKTLAGLDFLGDDVRRWLQDRDLDRLGETRLGDTVVEIIDPVADYAELMTELVG